MVHVHLPDSTAAADVAELIEQFGPLAANEAAARARHSRNKGNLVHFCRWRQIQRMIQLLSTSQDPTIH